MTLVYAGLTSHAPGMTGRAHMVENTNERDLLYAALDQQRQEIQDSGAEALIVVAAEHFANFFMDNMPAFAMGMSDHYDGPIEDPDWLQIPKFRAPGDRDLSQRLVTEVMQTVDVAYAEEWLFDHGIAVPLSFLTPRFDLPVVPVSTLAALALPNLGIARAVGLAFAVAASTSRGSKSGAASVSSSVFCGEMPLASRISGLGISAVLLSSAAAASSGVAGRSIGSEQAARAVPSRRAVTGRFSMSGPLRIVRRDERIRGRRVL